MSRERREMYVDVALTLSPFLKASHQISFSRETLGRWFSSPTCFPPPKCTWCQLSRSFSIAITSITIRRSCSVMWRWVARVFPFPDDIFEEEASTKKLSVGMLSNETSVELMWLLATAINSRSNISLSCTLYLRLSEGEARNDFNKCQSDCCTTTWKLPGLHKPKSPKDSPCWTFSRFPVYLPH